MIMTILIILAVLVVLALLIILWDCWRHGGAAIWDPEHPTRIITQKEAKRRERKSLQ